MSKYPRGSEWRKWDLHVHTPDTKLNNGYRVKSDEDVWDKFCEELESSDVQVFGITDYFSVENYFAFMERHRKKFPQSTKVFFPNIELRLNESVNKSQEEVNLHLIFRSNISQEKLEEFLRKLKTEITDTHERKLTCIELETEDQFQSCTVTRDSINDAFNDTFGKKVLRESYMVIVTAANNDGLRPQSGMRRKANITDQIDKFSDAYFGGSQNSTYFLNDGRLEDSSQKISKKPVFSGSDVHNFDDLVAWCGKTVNVNGTNKEITWVKADPTYEGLMQTLIEPGERVRISPTKPDSKEPYKVIRAVKFSGSKDFPSNTIELNPNLCSVIGSRSSGKSSLLAYMAYSINKNETLDRQRLSMDGVKEANIGPAAGKSWNDVAAINCEIEWESGAKGGGNVVYIPQNYLYSISSRPAEVTKKITPVLFKNHPIIKSQFDNTRSAIGEANQTIESLVNQWFDLTEAKDRLRKECRELGSKEEIENARDNYQGEINELKSKLSITEEDIQRYQEIIKELDKKKNEKDLLERKHTSIFPFLRIEEKSVEAAPLETRVTFRPSLDGLPSELNEELEKLIKGYADKLSGEVRARIVSYYTSLLEREATLDKEILTIMEQNKNLIEQNEQNKQLTTLVKHASEQAIKLNKINEKEREIKAKDEEIGRNIAALDESMKVRFGALQELTAKFETLDQSQYKIEFGMEYDFDEAELLILADKFNRRNTSNFIGAEDGSAIKFSEIRNNILAFLCAIQTGEQKLKVGQNARQVAKDLLTATEEIRFTAILEEDKIGGFSPSSMTPGKRALFALTLILSETDGAWPLLIDQPEDDLDSRSIYEQIVPYIVERKKERQIVMVSHNANLVIGADSEQLLVANKHGDDRKNKDEQMFDYLMGAMEDSKPKEPSEHVLASCGIREHACEILDGGEEAFEKRRNKYRL